jgi:phage terminase large subunit
VQWAGSEIKVLDYYESSGQVLAFHVNWLRSRGYQNAILYLPHDGVAANNITGKRHEDHLRDAGFAVEPPVKNQGRGAAMMRIEALRRLGPQLWFNDATTEAGREALGFYHERKDDARNIGLGPEHDWSSHAADALGLMAICWEQPDQARAFHRPDQICGWRVGVRDVG